MINLCKCMKKKEYNNKIYRFNKLKKMYSNLQRY